jgi:hypothetical protein
MTRARNTADTQTASGGPVSPSIAGKNKIINGDLGIWQRGTSISLTTGTAAYTSDRWNVVCNFTAGSASASQQTFTPGTAPVSGYEGTYFHRVTTGSISTYIEVKQNIEDVRTFAGQTVVLSFWAKASTAMTSSTLFRQEFGSGGSTLVDTSGASLSITTSWTRFTTSVTLPSVSGKTIGTSSMLRVYPISVTGTFTSATVDIWGVQLESGSTATAFQTASGSIQGELAACQRYYYRRTGTGGPLTFGMAPNSTTVAQTYFQHPVTMRTAPSAIEVSGVGATDEQTAYTTGTTTWDGSDTQATYVRYTHGSAALTAYRPYKLYNTGANSYLAVSAEL